MAAITEILTMVEKILLYVQEAEAAGILDIIKNALSSILALTELMPL